MPIKQTNGLRYFQFESFQSHPLTQALFTRHGGVSPQPWSSLNVGGTVGDAPDRVQENRERVFIGVGRPLESLHDVWQVHSADVVHVREPRRQGSLLKADGLITAVPGVTLFMRFADCVPIYLYDPRKHAIGMVHAGWLGTVRRAVSAAVQAMVRDLGSDPIDILAGIGPSIGPDHYEVGQDVHEQLCTSFGVEAAAFFRKRQGRMYLDLWSANRYLLAQQGVTKIETAGICTACRVEDWYSHRAEQGQTGRFAALFSLEAV
jgi:YfiH family protein